MWSDSLKEAGVSVHVIATGGGAGLQQILWEVPGSSSYLSGASFPYSPEEQEELLGFMPEHFCSEEAAIDLASAAYMKAFKFGGKKPVGVGITASVASEKEHRGDHRVHACIITDDKVIICNHTLIKGSGPFYRYADGEDCNKIGFVLLLNALGIYKPFTLPTFQYKDVTEQAIERFCLRPFFTMDGKRQKDTSGLHNFAIMPGAYNPPHEGHFGVADSFQNENNKRIIFEVSMKSSNKAPLTFQDMLKRAKMLNGRDRYFTQNMALYIEKARAFPGVPLVVGADAIIKLFDPKWGHNVTDVINEMINLKTSFYVADRLVDGKIVTYKDIINNYLHEQLKFIYPGDNNFLDRDSIANDLIKSVPGRWDISSTELRNKV